MAALPQNVDLPTMQNTWSRFLTPWLKNPQASGVYLNNIVLVTGSNVINHKLGRMMQGWVIVDIQGVATIYRSAAFNDLTLTLTASAGVTINLYVF